MIRTLAFPVALLTSLPFFAGACATDEVPIDGILQPGMSPEPPGQGSPESSPDERGPDGGSDGHLFITVLSSDEGVDLPYEGETPSGMRIRLNGDYLLTETDHGLEYTRLLNRGGGIGRALPVGAYVVELVLDDDSVWFTSPPLAVNETDISIWSRLWISPDASQMWSWLPTADDNEDRDKVRVDIQNAADRPLVIYRCLGWFRPVDGPTAGDCLQLGTVAAEGRWNEPVETSQSGEEVARVYGHLEGEAFSTLTRIAHVGYPRGYDGHGSVGVLVLPSKLGPMLDVRE